VQVQLPPAVTVALHRVVPPSRTVTAAPGSPVPDTAGVRRLVRPPGAGEVIAGAAGAAVSITTATAPDAADTLPAASVAFAVRTWAPSVRADVGQLNAPPADAVVVQTRVAPSYTRTVEPDSAVPVTVGVAVVREPPAVGAEITGAAGAVVSTVKVVLDAAETLPAASAWVTDQVCEPAPRATAAEQLQAPPAATTAVQIVAAPSRTVTVAPGSPVPEAVGVVTFVLLPVAGAVTTGAAGAVPSTVRLIAVDAGEALPARSVWVARRGCGPSASDAEVQDQVPPAVTVAVQTGVAPSLTVMVAFGSPVPEMAGVRLPVSVPLAGAEITGAAGAVTSMVKATVFDTGE